MSLGDAGSVNASLMDKTTALIHKSRSLSGNATCCLWVIMKRTALLRKTPLRSSPPKWKSRAKEPRGPRIDKSALNVPTCERIRDADYLKWIRSLRCCACGASGPVHAHHLTHAQPKARGLKAGDQFAAPVCRSCHQDGPLSIHGDGNERAWWERRGIDAIAVCEKLRREYLSE